MSAAVVLPFVQAFAQGPSLPILVTPIPVSPAGERLPSRPPQPYVGIYRKYTVALLRRYLSLSLKAGRVPSVLGQEMFRANITHYRTATFEDVVIFLHDVDRSLEKLTPEQQHLIARITLQEFTVGEVSAALSADPRTIIRRHTRALDSLTRIFLDVKIFTPPIYCQGGKSDASSPNGLFCAT